MPPDEFNDETGVLEFVSRTDGAIGIIPSSAKDRVGGNCKIISLE